MTSNTQRLGTAFESRELDQLVALLDDRVVWRGLLGFDYGLAAEPEHGQPHEPDDHDHVPLCTSREDVQALLEGFLSAGGTGQPVVIAEAGDSLIVDLRPEPAIPFPLHHAFTFRGGRIVLIQDYPDAATALADVTR